jgi:hypothetical protein
MPFDRNRLVTWADTQHTRTAKYSTPDAQSVIEAANYFTPVWEILPKATTIECVAVTGGTPILLQYIVTASAAGGVTIALQKTSAA